MKLISLLNNSLLVPSVILVQGVRSVLSSEYLIMEQLFCVACKSSVNIEKILGPPTVPCEHPVWIAICGYCVLLKTRPCDRLMLKLKSLSWI